jgi:type III secretion system chaperone SycN
MIPAAVADFGAMLGISSLELSADGTAVLDIEPSDTLCLAQRGDSLFVSLSRERDYPNTPPAPRLLELLHFHNTGGAPIRCRRTAFGRTTVLLETLPGTGLRGSDVMASLDRLTKLHNAGESQ